MNTTFKVWCDSIGELNTSLPISKRTLQSLHHCADLSAQWRSDRRNGVVVRVFVSLSVDLGFISLAKSYKETLKMISRASLLGARHLREIVENKPASSLAVLSAKALNGTPHLYVEDRWPRHLGNGNSLASEDVPSKI